MGRKKKSKAKYVVAGVVIAVIAVIVIAFTLVPSINPISSEFIQTMSLQNDFGTRIAPSLINNERTIHYTEDVWTGQNIPGTAGYPNTEIFDSDKYTTTKTVTAAILFKGNIYKSAKGQTAVSQRVFYNVYINEIGKTVGWKKIIGLNFKDTAYISYADSISWRTFKSYPGDSGAQTIRASTGSCTIKGLHKAAIRIDMVVEFMNDKTKNTYQKVMATDYAYLV